MSKPLSGCVEAPALLAWGIGIRGDSSEIQLLVYRKIILHGRTSRAYSSGALSQDSGRRRAGWVDLVCFVHLVRLVQPNKLNKQEKPAVLALLAAGPSPSPSGSD